MKNFLNLEMQLRQSISDDDLNNLRAAFKNSCQIIKSLLGKNAFKRFHRGTDSNENGSWEEKRFSASLYDILMWSFAKEDKNKVYQNLDQIREAFINIMTTDEEFIDSIERSTSSLQAVRKRFDKWRLAVEAIIGVEQKEDRCFSYELKRELFAHDSTCAICGNSIQDIDDAAVDHIHQYWMGGKTIPENARLTHRFCNWSRPRKE